MTNDKVRMTKKGRHGLRYLIIRHSSLRAEIPRRSLS
jgi:hypothetical protein